MSKDYIDAVTKTDEPYNLSSGIFAVGTAVTAVAAIATSFLTTSPLPIYILSGVAFAFLITSAILKLVASYKRNREITDRLERNREMEVKLAQQQIMSNTPKLVPIVPPVPVQQPMMQMPHVHTHPMPFNFQQQLPLNINNDIPMVDNKEQRGEEQNLI